MKRKRKKMTRQRRQAHRSIEIQESTMQLPFGEFSVLSELEKGELNAAQAMTQLMLGYRSNWRSGKTWRTSQTTLAQGLGISNRYVRNITAHLKEMGWLSVAKKPRGTDGTIYQLVLHNCEMAMVPTDADGEPCTFAVPRGKGGIFERMNEGILDWKSALVWLMLKLKSDWRTGISDAVSLRALAKRVRLGTQTVCDAIKRLVKVGMLKRLSARHERSVFQLYPKPPEREKKAPRQKPKQGSVRTVRRDGHWVYSGNEKYRLDLRSEEVYHKPERRRGVWKRVRHERRHEIPLPIQRAFEVSLNCERLRRRLGSEESPQWS